MLFFKQFGVGLATAVLLDATIVRAVLLPASMKLLGSWNWYLPHWLGWLPKTTTPGPEMVSSGEYARAQQEKPRQLAQR
jgi:RND superfamily putative drug exporter